MRRRRFVTALSVGGLAALAGCSGPNGSLQLSLVDNDSDLAGEYASPVDGLPEELRTFLVSVIEEGPGTREGTSPPFDRERPVEHEGAFYEFDHEIVDAREEPQYVIDVDFDSVDAGDRDAIEYDDLPAVDREALSSAFPPPDDPPENDGPDLGVGHVYERESDSVLVPEPEYDAVIYDGSAYPIQVQHSRDVTIATYRYTADQIAADATDLGGRLREEYRFELRGLTDDEREIVEEAIEGSYYVGPGDPPEAFTSLLDRFEDHEPVERDEYGGEWLARYDGSDYWTDVDFPYDSTPSGTPGTTPPVTPPPE